MNPTIEVLSYALRKLHRPSQYMGDEGRVLRCVHCAELAPASPATLWPCPTIALAGAVLRGEA